MPAAIGVDVGGSKLATVVVDADGAIRYEQWVRRGVEPVQAQVRGSARRAMESAAAIGLTVDAIGLSLAAWLDADRRVVRQGANLGLTSVPIRDLIDEDVAVPVSAINDGDSTAWAEYRLGSARGARSAAVITIGTGVGGGIVAGGALLVGAGLAGEIGHLRVSDSGQRCVCGSTGCLELFASGTALGAAARELRRSGQSPILQGIPDHEIDARALGAAADDGDTAAANEIDRAARAVAVALRMIAAICDPDVVVIGGSVGIGLGSRLTSGIDRALTEDSPLSLIRPPQRVVTTSLGPVSAAVGAALIALERPQPQGAP